MEGSAKWLNLKKRKDKKESFYLHRATSNNTPDSGGYSTWEVTEGMECQWSV